MGERGLVGIESDALEKQLKLAQAVQPLAKCLMDVADVLIEIVVAGVTKRLGETLQPPEPRYYDRAETAKILHVSLPTLKALSDRGQIMPHKSGRRVLFDAEQIDELANGKEPIKYASRYRKEKNCILHGNWKGEDLGKRG